MKNAIKLHRSRTLASFIAVLAVFLFTLCTFVGVFWWSGREYAHLSFSQKYYFLVRDCEATTAAAVAGQVYVSGGSGYCIEVGGESAVVLSCYFKKETAGSVCESMQAKGEEVRVVALAPDDMYLNGNLAKESARISDNAETVDSFARLLYDTANGLERTELSQDEARAAVRGVQKSLNGLRSENDGEAYGRWNAVLVEAERRCGESADGILFSKDVRYIQAFLCYAVANIGDYFG